MKFLLYLFNLRTEKEKEGKNDDKLAYRDFVFAFKLIFVLGGQEGERKTGKHQGMIVKW